METQRYENYPLWMVRMGVSTAVATYVLGACILAGFGAYMSILYLALCTFAEWSILRGSCVHCFYYGKLCGLGRGKLCPILFKKGEPRSFLHREVSARDIIPDVLVLAIPLLGGTALLFRQFNWAILFAMLLIVVLATAGNAYVRGSLACRHCAQRDLGCPTTKFFSRQET